MGEQDRRQDQLESAAADVAAAMVEARMAARRLERANQHLLSLVALPPVEEDGHGGND